MFFVEFLFQNDLTNDLLERLVLLAETLEFSTGGVGVPCLLSEPGFHGLFGDQICFRDIGNAHTVVFD